MNPIKLVALTYAFLLLFGIANITKAQNNNLRGWKTNTDKSLIDLSELRRGGPPKDGIPSIDRPQFIQQGEAESWLSDKEPVISLVYQGEARAYPLQILMWHEIVNDRIAGEPVLVTFCPLCYSALVFKRTLDGEEHEFGVSGFLRHSDLVMFDRKTETLWQQFNGKAIVGDYVGKKLDQIPSQIISFKQFQNSYPNGVVLSRNTGYRRDYGRNPYAGYDDINNTPMMGAGGTDGPLPPMEKVIGVQIGDATKTYPYSVSKKEKVINDSVGDEKIVVFHLDGAQSALDAARIANSRESGSTGVFRRAAGGKRLTFELRSDGVYDRETGSRWNITGQATQGPLKGEQLETVNSGDYFAFAWLVFWPETTIYGQ